jgi:ribosome-associated protein
LGEWVLIDLDDVIVHIFNEPARMYYNFDRLWGHVPSFEPEEASIQTPKFESQSRHPM